MTNELSNSPHARDISYHLHPQTDLSRHEQIGPHIIERGDGIYVFDDEGKSYIEGLSGLWCASLGFSEERLVQAANRQLRTLPFYHGFAHKASNPVIDLAERLINIAPAPLTKAFFTNSGSEANDTQVKLVWYYNNILGRPDKKKIISRHGAYHGITVASGSLTGLPYAHKYFDLPIPNVLFVDPPHHYHYAQDGETETDFASRLANDLEHLILDEDPETVAAFIAEPVMGAGGVGLNEIQDFHRLDNTQRIALTHRLTDSHKRIAVGRRRVIKRANHRCRNDMSTVDCRLTVASCRFDWGWRLCNGRLGHRRSDDGSAGYHRRHTRNRRDDTATDTHGLFAFFNFDFGDTRLL